MLTGLDISNSSSIRSALVLENKEDLIPEGKPVSIGKTLEACWVRELRKAYLNLFKRFVKRTVLAFLLFVGSVVFFFGVATAAEQVGLLYQTASAHTHGASTIESGVTCEKGTGCSYLA
ncbi:MAG: hypothetical protein KDD70_00180 [Bdellovibrionales bacterium]|nr:hypothetical protein [Bdellovibrionales bacterium]